MQVGWNQDLSLRLMPKVPMAAAHKATQAAIAAMESEPVEARGSSPRFFSGALPSCFWPAPLPAAEPEVPGLPGMVVPGTRLLDAAMACARF